MERWHMLSSGVVAALVGFGSSAMVVIAGLRAVGATPTEAASGLLALSVTQGLGTIWLTRRHRLPVLLAWSTPGAALLASTGHVPGGWPAALGAFLVGGLLILLTGSWPRLGRVIASIPASLAQAMLAGVLLELCLAPVHGVTAHPALVAPPLLVWLALLRWAPRWAVPAAFVVAMLALTIWIAHHGGADGPLLPHLQAHRPTLTWAALLSITVPLYLVTMASQNVPGVAVLASYGYDAPWRPAMTVTGIGTALGAAAGGHAINLAAITAALVASPEAHPEHERRWRVAEITGWSYLVLALGSTALTTVVAAAPDGVVTAVAGIALAGTLASALAAALSEQEDRIAAVVTFVVAGSGISALGIGAAFWALVAGLTTRLATRPRSDRAGRTQTASTRREPLGDHPPADVS
jgi:benzoate membrane transport protein